MRLAPVRRNWFPERCHQSVRLLTPFCRVQAKMGGDDAEHSFADQKVGVHSDSCIGCEMCFNTCPFNSVSLEETTPAEFATGGYYSIPQGGFEEDKFAKDFQRGLKLSRPER